MVILAELPGGVILRCLEGGDAPALLDAYLRNRDHLHPFDPVRPDSFWTLDGQRERLGSLLRQHSEGTLFACALQRGDQIVGCASLHGIVFGPMCSTSLGYWVDAGEVGKGLASATVATLCRIADQDLGLHRVEASTDHKNLASQRVLTKNGLHHFGTAHDYVYLNGMWQDSMLFQRVLNDRPPVTQ
ncbi:MAG TPA: GNAT family protein [Micromonosporaceae bacterium]|nr:GNAT family protein [Micromonosporaceae bacterium]